MKKLYAYKNCSTCKKAQKFVESLNANDIQTIDIVSSPPSRSELEEMLAVYGGNIRKLFNTSGKLYREKGLSAALREMSTNDALSLLEGEGMLVKRPFLIGDGVALVGFKQEDWEQVL